MLPRKSKQPLSSAFPQPAQSQEQQQFAAKELALQQQPHPSSPTRHVTQDPLTTGYRHSLSPSPSPEPQQRRLERSANAHAILIGDSPMTPADGLLKEQSHNPHHHSSVIPPAQPPAQSYNHPILLDRHDEVTPDACETPESSAEDIDEQDADDSALSMSSRIDSGSDEHADDANHSGDEQMRANTPSDAAARASLKASRKKKKPAKSSNAVLPEELQGHYVVTEYLGSGSYGHVYLANPTEQHPLFSVPTPEQPVPSPSDPSLPSMSPPPPHQIPSQVAIKKIVHIFDNLTNAKRLLREIKILRMLAHSNIISFKGLLPPAHLETFNDLSMVFEYVDTDLQKLIHSNQHFSILHVQFFLYQLLCGLEYTHSAGVIHRDLKPANVLVNADCSLKLCDFGLSRLTNNSRISKSANEQRTTAAPTDSKQNRSGRDSADMMSGYANNSEANTPSKRMTPSDQNSHSSTPSTDGGDAQSTQSSTELPAAPQPQRTMTKHVVTRWYRAPEVSLFLFLRRLV